MCRVLISGSPVFTLFAVTCQCLWRDLPVRVLHLLITMSALDMSLDQLMKRGSSRPAKGGGPGKVTASSRAIRRPAPYAAAKSAGKGSGRAQPQGGKSVYVGNLAWDVSWQDLKDHFKTVGQVLNADVMMEPGTTRSKGCGLVTFANARDAATAISTLHDTELNGRLIFVREDREGGAGVGMAGRGGSAVAPTDGCKVFVGGLPRETTWMDLKDMFREAGSVVRADVAQAPDGTSKGYGTVLLGSTREAAKAIQLFNETEYQGRTIQVRPDAHP